MQNSLHVGLFQDTDLDTQNALSAVKSLLQKAQPHLLARLPKVTAKGYVLSIMIDPSKGLACKKLTSEELGAHTEFMSLDNIDQLSLMVFSKVMI